MARLKTKDIRDLTLEELKEKAEGLKKELFSLRVQARLGKLEKHSTIRMTKRDIARIFTVMNEPKKEELAVKNESEEKSRTRLGKKSDKPRKKKS